MNKQLKASFMISLMLITLVSAVFNVNAISDSNRMYVLKSDNPPIANFTIKNDNARGCVVFNGFSSYDIDGYIVLYDWDYGDGNTFNSSISGWGFNQYCDDETYNVTLTVTDNDGLTGNLTKSVDIILANLGPPYVEIDGPDSGNAGAEYEFRFKIFCEYLAPFYIIVNWGDDNNTGWIGVQNGYVDLSHIWSEEGKYTIRAKAKDDCREGSWTEFEVTMPRTKSIKNILFLHFLEHYPLLQQLFVIFFHKFCINRATYSIY